MGRDLVGLTGEPEYGQYGTHGNQSMEDIAEIAELYPESQLGDPMLNTSVDVPHGNSLRSGTEASRTNNHQRRSPNESSNRVDPTNPLKYARNVMMNIHTQDYGTSQVDMRRNVSPTSEMLVTRPQEPRSPFAQSGLEIAGVLSSAVQGQSPTNNNHVQLDSSAIQQYTNSELHGHSTKLPFVRSQVGASATPEQVPLPYNFGQRGGDAHASKIMSKTHQYTVHKMPKFANGKGTNKK